ncbi:MAG: hypothetical protein JST49_13215 [Bacteroidetes bacterium]|nr:hypothetical protein [Bacteroidota bacterium]
MLNTIKRNIKGRSLTHQEFDNNWTAIESIVNNNMPQQRYEIAIQGYNNAVGLDYVEAFISIKTLVELKEMPKLKCWAVNQGVIIAICQGKDFFEGLSFPIPSNTILSQTYSLRVNMTPNLERDWDAVAYLQDSNAHFSNSLNIPPLIFLQQADD